MYRTYLNILTLSLPKPHIIINYYLFLSNLTGKGTLLALICTKGRAGEGGLGVRIGLKGIAHRSE